MLLWTLALFVIVEPIVGHLIEPWVQGQNTGLSPLAIVIAAVMWTALWGPIGLLLATPLTVSLVVLGRHVEGLAFLDVILGDEPALSPAEVFYQRLLAGSAIEAADQAHQLIKATSLVTFDAERGRIDEARLAAFHDAVLVLLDDLADLPLVPPSGAPAITSTSAGVDTELIAAPNADVARVLCLGARTSLDTAAAEILAHTLRRHGIATQVSAVTRLADASQLDLAGVEVVWISSIKTARSQAQLRYLVRRLRRRAPHVVLYAGVWGESAETTTVNDLGVTNQASSFAEAVELASALASNSPTERLMGLELNTQTRVIQAGDARL
jgi:hypothetical protein